MGPNVESWARDLNAAGISTFALDGFTGRGLTSVNMDQAALGRLAFTLDAYRSLEMLAKHPRVDPARIAVMGFSRGGQGALFASLKRFHAAWNRSGAEFAAYIPFYPDCMTTYISDSEIAEKPIRIFHGAPDDYNPVRRAGAMSSGCARRAATCSSRNIPTPSTALTIRSVRLRRSPSKGRRRCATARSPKSPKAS